MKSLVLSYWTNLNKRGSNSERDVGEVTYLKSIISDPFKGIVERDCLKLGL